MADKPTVQHDPDMTQLVTSLINSITRVEVNSSRLPRAKCVWEVDASAEGATDPQQAMQMVLLYNNAIYDLVAAVIAKLGVEYSKLVSGVGDDKAFDAEVKKVLEVLNAGTNT